MRAVSKAFRANVGQHREHEAVNLQRFAMNTCAVSTVFRADSGLTVLIALKDVARSSASFARTIRAAMRMMGMETAGLRGHWCTLISEREAIALATDVGLDLPAATCAPDNSERRLADSRRASSEDGDVKIVPIRSERWPRASPPKIPLVHTAANSSRQRASRNTCATSSPAPHRRRRAGSSREFGAGIVAKASTQRAV